MGATNVRYSSGRLTSPNRTRGGCPAAKGATKRLQLPTGKEVDLVVQATRNGQAAGDLSTESLDSAQSMSGMVFDHIDDCSAAGAVLAGDNGVRGAAGGRKADCDKTRAWLLPFVRRSWAKGDASANGFRASATGAVGGIDHLLDGGSVLGMSFGYVSDETNIKGAPTQGKSDAWFVGGYARTNVGAATADGQVFYMKDSWNLRRDTQFAGIATSSPDSKVWGGAAQVSAPMGSDVVVPHVRLSYAHVERDATTETGAGAMNLQVNGATSESLRGAIGVTLNMNKQTSTGSLSSLLKFDVEQEFASVNRSSTASLAGIPGTTFTAPSLTPGRTAFVTGAQVKANVKGNFSLYGDLLGRFSDHQTETTLSVGGTWRF